MRDAAKSGWYDNGPADYREPPTALANDFALDGASDEGGSDAPAFIDATYSNAWPGTGSGIYSWVSFLTAHATKTLSMPPRLRAVFLRITETIGRAIAPPALTTRRAAAAP
jgi:hypothetical protein